MARFQILLTTSNILTAVISVATLVVNIVLVFITRRGRLLTRAGRSDLKRLAIPNKGCNANLPRFNSEKGLIFTSAFSYVFQTMYLVNRVCSLPMR